jgi:hypothetical protein
VNHVHLSVRHLDLAAVCNLTPDALSFEVPASTSGWMVGDSHTGRTAESERLVVGRITAVETVQRKPLSRGYGPPLPA